MPGPDGWFTHAQGRETAVLLISVASAVQCVRSAETRTRSRQYGCQRFCDGAQSPAAYASPAVGGACSGGG